ncbi:helix-turn-helix domain-containing protein [Lactobacillus crispatus]|uniref:helix-turn-helix domain-containing protein n=2 Tax=Lactobacillus crispatus TaxID=47770 RepID=UPI0018E319D3|nr:helix-turn-helix domain-containing protein [Lactobacillus crispatus]MBI1704659.1 DNA-binding protein [Lactobacillus crispatus]MBI1704709.1 DNA-binding protein [Lactobacillus crispatus]
MNQPSYYSIMPAYVRYDKDLKPNEKLLYSEITALSNKFGYCTASNNYFAPLYDVSKETVSRWISHLKKKGYIQVEIIRAADKTVQQRRIYVSVEGEVLTKRSIGYCQKDQDPIDENVKDNITRDNTTSNNINSSSSHSKPSPQNETVDNSKDQKDEEEETKINSRMNKLFFTIRKFNKTFNQDTRPTLRQLKQIRLKVSMLSDDDFEGFSDFYDERVSACLVDNPIGYLITMLNDEIKIERYYKK